VGLSPEWQREVLKTLYSHGGSAKTQKQMHPNCRSLNPNIDGGLIGGAAFEMRRL